MSQADNSTLGERNEVQSNLPLLDGEEASLYEMNVLVQPPPQIRPGEVLNPPVVVRLEKIAGCNYSEFAAYDPAVLWAFVSVTTEDGQTSLAPPRDDLLSGTPTDSVHTLDYAEGHEAGFMSFTDIAIRDSGRYRLRISLVKVNAPGNNSSNVNLQSTLSRVIHVDVRAGTPSPGKSCSLSFGCKLTDNRSGGAETPPLTESAGSPHR